MANPSKLVICVVLAFLGLSVHAAGTFKNRTATGTSTIYWSGFGNVIGVLPNLGWLPAVVPSPDNSPLVKQQLPLPINNKDVIIDVEARVIKDSKLATSVIKFGKLMPVLSNVIAAAELVDFLKESFGAESLTLKNNSGQLEVDVVSNGDGYEYGVALASGYTYFPTPQAACQARYAFINSSTTTTNVLTFTSVLSTGTSGILNTCDATRTYYIGSTPYTVSSGNYQSFLRRAVTSSSTETKTEQQIFDKIANSSGWPASSAPLIRKMLQEPTIEIPIDPNTIKTSGPASVPGETKKTTEQVRLQPGTNVEAPPSATTATDPGTKTTTSTQTTKLLYQGDTVTYNTTTNNSTTNITNNTTNTTTITGEKTEETQDKEKLPDFCQTNPESIACKSLGTLEPLPVPNIDKVLEIKRNEGWGPSNGTCPAPRSLVLQGGLTLEMPFDHLCQFADGIRPIVIALAWLSATFSFMGIGRKS